MSATASARAAIPRNRRDPTGTATIRDRYAQRLRGAFADLNTLVRAGVRDRDIFGLDMDVLQDGDDLPPLMRLDRDERKLALFDQWLQARIDEDILEVIDRDENRFVRAAYARGLQDADQALAAIGIDVPDQDVEDIFALGVHRNRVEDLYAQNFADLTDITQEMSRQIGDELATGFAAGEGPDDIARRITDRVDKIGKTRATTLARTRIIDAHAEATLNRYDNFGVTGIRVHAEWATAGDQRVCPICENLEGETWTIDEARTGTIELTEDDVAGAVPEGRSASEFTGEFPIKPPAHPRCRCRLLPEVRAG